MFNSIIALYQLPEQGKYFARISQNILYIGIHIFVKNIFQSIDPKYFFDDKSYKFFSVWQWKFADTILFLSSSHRAHNNIIVESRYQVITPSDWSPDTDQVKLFEAEKIFRTNRTSNDSD